MTRLNSQTTARHKLRAEKAQRNRDAALAAFVAQKAEIDAMLARLQALSDDHFNTDPGAIDWADVGTLDHYARQLRGLTDSAFGEGEYAD